MKRSEINLLIKQACDLFASLNFALPPFAFWTPQYWQSVGDEAAEIRNNELGWDVTDYDGQGKPGHALSLSLE